MEPTIVLDLFQEGIFLLILIVTILILPGLLLGLVVSVFQAATQINEQSLSFIPRLLITFFTILITGPLLLKLMTDFVYSLFEQLPGLVG